MGNISEPAEQVIEIRFFAGFFAKIICRRLRRLVKFVNPYPGFRFAPPGAIFLTPAPQAFGIVISKLRIAGLFQTSIDFSRLFSTYLACEQEMSDSVAYNIPISMLETYRGRTLIVRSQNPSEFVDRLSQEDLNNILNVQLLSLNAEVGDLVHWAVSLPIDVVMRDPVSEFPLLYRFSDVVDNHPIRVSVPIAAGFSKAVKLAASMNFAVKMEIAGQLDQALIDELSQVLDLYLHRPSVSQPVEFFYSTFLAFYQGNDSTLWSIQEEDPAYFRYIADDGEETVSRRFAGGRLNGDVGAFVTEYQRQLLAEKSECNGCEFFANCGGYFKWPDKKYHCDGVKTLFSMIKEAAGELRRDLDAFPESQGEK